MSANMKNRNSCLIKVNAKIQAVCLRQRELELKNLRESERERDRQTDRQADRQAGRQAGRETEKEIIST